MSVFVDVASNLHPFDCDGPGECIHCDRRIVVRHGVYTHHPGDCALCDPEYDGQPNPAVVPGKQSTGAGASDA